MKLALYSGGSGQENRNLVKETLSLLEGVEDPVVVFVPSDSEDSEEDFLVFRRKFARTRIKKFRCVAIDRNLSARSQQALFSADAIFLGGGNTFYFLKHVRQRRLLNRFKRFVANGGVLMGLSAGSILMTPSIMTAAVPSLDRDENEVGLRSLSALGLVPFEFSPHYEACRSVDQELLEYSQELEYPIYACADGEGIIVDRGRIRFIGRVNVFHRGRKFRAPADVSLQ